MLVLCAAELQLHVRLVKVVLAFSGMSVSQDSVTKAAASLCLHEALRVQENYEFHSPTDLAWDQAVWNDVVRSAMLGAQTGGCRDSCHEGNLSYVFSIKRR